MVVVRWWMYSSFDCLRPWCSTPISPRVATGMVSPERIFSSIFASVASGSL